MKPGTARIDDSADREERQIRMLERMEEDLRRLEYELRDRMEDYEARLREFIAQHERSSDTRAWGEPAPMTPSMELRDITPDPARGEAESLRSQLESAESVVERSMQWMIAMRSEMDLERHQSSDKMAQAVSEVRDLSAAVESSMAAYEKRFEAIEHLTRETMEAELRSLATVVHRESEDRLARSLKEWSELTTASEDRLKAIEDTYRQKMALQAPVDYWQQNRDEHRKEAHRYLKVVWWTGPLVFVATAALGWVLLGADREPAWGHAILFFVNAAMLVWGLRVIVRLYLGHLNLATESNERIVMAKSYLALTSQGVSVGPTETAIVFGSLFGRLPTTTVKDDGVPPSAIEMASGLLKGKE